MRFEEAFSGCTGLCLTQEDTSRLLGVCSRTFRHNIDRYEEEGLDGLLNKLLTQVSHRRAPVDEVLRLVDCYRRCYDGWNVKQYIAGIGVTAARAATVTTRDKTGQGIVEKVLTMNMGMAVIMVNIAVLNIARVQNSHGNLGSFRLFNVAIRCVIHTHTSFQ